MGNLRNPIFLNSYILSWLWNNLKKLEEVGYIYEKAGKFETAIEYYEKAKQMYELAYEEDPASVYTHQIDGDWDYYKEIFLFAASRNKNV
jgi:tetratricopeptide (TPR) repeat protein